MSTSTNLLPILYIFQNTSHTTSKNGIVNKSIWIRVNKKYILAD